VRATEEAVVAAATAQAVAAEAATLWELRALEDKRYGDADVDEDQRALETLLAAIPTEMHSSLVNK
jgi:hypothetical protein